MNRSAAPSGRAPAADPGRAAEDRALQHLRSQGLQVLQRNYRVARGPAARAGEIDLIMRDRDGTIVFVEVRARGNTRQGGAAASIGPAKQRRIVYAARHWLMRLQRLPPCRFDVVAIDGDHIEWLAGAFEAAG